ncbi:hypothetical protein [Bacillus sp. 1P06AnD]|uniref:hypothetical protein n=1 Tax=Bacillus sp. 1P06AnD TaxID=3132208 RepID=UPI0039A2B1F6
MDVPSKTHYIGNTVITIHSPLVNMNEIEREKWFEQELNNGNPVIHNIVNTLKNWYGK